MAQPFDQTTRALAQQGPTAAMLGWALAAACLAAWATWFMQGHVTLYESSPKARLEVSRAAHPVAATLAGRLARPLPALGTAVKAGEVIAELDADDLRLRHDEATAHVRTLGTQVQALRDEISARQQAAAQEEQAAQAAVQGAQFKTQEAQAAAAFASEREKRVRQDVDSGGAAAIDASSAGADAQRLQAAKGAAAAEARKLAADARARAAQLLAQIEGLKRQLAALQGEQIGQQALIARLALEIEQHRVRAPVTGTLGEVQALREGAVLSAGQRLATVVPTGELLVVAEFEPAAVLGRIHPGQRAQMRLDGFPWMQFGTLGAVVSRVGTEIRDQRVQVELTLQGPAPAGITLQHGLPGTIEVALDDVSPLQLLWQSAGLGLRRGTTP